VVTDEDQAFYTKMGVPAPTLCPEERMRRRLAHRNERRLYHRKCDLCKKEIIAMYSAESSYNIYCQTCWWSDKWDAKSFAQEVDFNRPFFDQMAELMHKVPRISLMNKEHENAEYCNFAWRNKNSYLCTTSGECEDAFYTKRSWNCRNVADCSNMTACELCYECIDCRNCYNCLWLQNSSDSTDCTLGYNLKNCKNCFGCYNLVNQSFCIYNEKYSPEEYAKKLSELKKNLPAEVEKFQKLHTISRKFMDAINVEHCSGDAVYNSKNAQFCFDVNQMEDCKFVFDASFVKDAYDVNNEDHSELVYEANGSETNYMHRFSDICWFNKFLTYCSLCFHSEYLFGCVGMNKGKYCILNKEYSKKDYEALVVRIVEHMKQTGEWGEYFPMQLSAFAYNETVANDTYPLKEEEAKKQGLRWAKDTEELAYQGPKLTPPENINEADAETTKKIYTCSVSEKFYRITPQEFELYKKLGVPLPKKCPEQRFKERMARKNPRVLWQRPCSSCGITLQTVYPLERPERVLCETCYLKEMY
jgi:hypothetical protein